MNDMREVRVAEVRQECEGVRAFVLEAPGGVELPAFEAGAHIDVRTGEAGLRQYSLCNAPSERRHYLIAVKREPRGRGGSLWMHDRLREGDRLSIGMPRNNFGLDANAGHHLLVAGGIGLTPLLSMAEQLWARDEDFSLYCFARSRTQLAFAKRLQTAPWAPRVKLHFEAPDEPKLDLDVLLGDVRRGARLYMCGPPGFMAAVSHAARAWPSDAIHFEHFAPAGPAPDTNAARAFEVQLVRSRRRLMVPADRSLLSVLQEAGVPLVTSCEQGVCGTCVTRYLEGEPEHADSCLAPSERVSRVALCCARSRSALLVLDL